MPEQDVCCVLHTAEIDEVYLPALEVMLSGMYLSSLCVEIC